MRARRPALLAVAIACVGCHAVYPYATNEAPRDASGDGAARDLPGAVIDQRPRADAGPDLPPLPDGGPDLLPPTDADFDQPPAVDAPPPDGPPPPPDQGVSDTPPPPDQGTPDAQAPDQGTVSCTDDCAYAEVRCDANGTALQYCGYHDADPCLDWGAGVPCPAGQVCNAATDPDACLPACYPACECTPYQTRLCTVGECAGMETCTTAGSWGPCALTGAPSVEICDGKDNDCNAVVDDNPTDTPPTCLQADLCYTRTPQCLGGAWQCVDTPACATDATCFSGVCCCQGLECGPDPACGIYDAKDVCGTCGVGFACSGGQCVSIN